MREFRKLIILITLVMLVVVSGQLFSLRGLFTTELEQQRLTISDTLSNTPSSQLTNNASELISRLGLSSLEIRQNNTLIANEVGRPQHWLPLIFATHLTRENTLQIGDLQVTYLPDYLKLTKHQQTILISIAAGMLLFLVLITILIAKSFRDVQKHLVQSLQDEHTDSPSFGDVSQLFQEQKDAFHKQLREQRHEIESLANQLKLDELTGLQNRHLFRQVLTELLKAPKVSAVLVYIRASQLSRINHLCGQARGDKYLCDIAKILTTASQQLAGSAVFRVSGSDFALLCNKFNPNNHTQLAGKLQENLERYRNSTRFDNIAYMGLTPVYAGETIESLIGRTELALAKAQTHSPNGWTYQSSNASKADLVIEQWQATITNVLQHGSIRLFHQPVQSLHRNMRLYQEMLSQFITSKGKTLPTDETIAMALRLELLEPLERKMIENIFLEISASHEKHQYWGVNLSALAVQSASFVRWLEQKIVQNSKISSFLVFELEELLVDTHLQAAKRLNDMLRRNGCRIALSRYGRGIASFRLFKELRPDYIKIDANLISGIDSDPTQQQFIRMIVEIAHRVGCQVIAEGVETLSQKQALESMYVDGLQGFLISKPISRPK